MTTLISPFEWDAIPARWHRNIVVVERGPIEGVEGPCWRWTGWSNSCGSRPPDVAHGRVCVGGRGEYLHRVSWEAYTGQKIPKADVMDHLCRFPPCFCPWHVEPVSQKVNIQRGRAAGTLFQPLRIIESGHEHLSAIDVAALAGDWRTVYGYG